MSKAMQIVGIILLGIFTLVIINLMNDVRSTNELDYYLLQETVEASMYDAIDYSYYRETGLIKVDRDMFLESFNRRFAESVDSSNLREYKIKILDFNETPPKASVEVTTVTAASVKGEGVSVVNRVDGIIETIYDDYVYSRGFYQMLVNPSPTPTPTPTPKPKVTIALDNNGQCNTETCSNQNYTGSFSGSSHYDEDNRRWNGPDETRTGPSFTMDLTDVTKMNLDYSIHLGGSYDAYDSITITLNCGGKTTSVYKGEHNEHNFAGTITADVSGISGIQTCATSIRFTGGGANNKYGYNNGASYNISRIYPTY